MNRLYENEIFNSHPETSKDPMRFKADVLAMELVRDRQSKRELVDVIRWLIMDNAKTANEALSNDSNQSEA